MELPVALGLTKKTQQNCTEASQLTSRIRPIKADCKHQESKGKTENNKKMKRKRKARKQSQRVIGCFSTKIQLHNSSDCKPYVQHIQT